MNYEQEKLQIEVTNNSVNIDRCIYIYLYLGKSLDAANFQTIRLVEVEDIFQLQFN